MTEIYLTISPSTHNGDDTPQKYHFTLRRGNLRNVRVYYMLVCWITVGTLFRVKFLQGFGLRIFVY